MKDERVILPTLWIFVVFNYLYCDVVTLMDSRILKQIMNGTVGGTTMTEGFLFYASLLMEIPIAMVFLSRLLKHKANRFANIIAGIIMTVVQISSLFMGGMPASYYIFFSVIEIACTSLIVMYSIRWRNPENIIATQV
jgi:hypothetical protein